MKRGAPIIAEVAGYGMTGDAYHLTQPAPEGEGAARSMLRAIRDAGLEPEEIDYINAHVIQMPLFLTGQVVLLGISKVILGWPLLIAALFVIGLLLSKGRTPMEDSGLAHQAEDPAPA